MERIALIADVHSNIVALKEVLKDIENEIFPKFFALEIWF